MRNALGKRDFEGLKYKGLPVVTMTDGKGLADTKELN
jgi:hypothetical protein